MEDTYFWRKHGRPHVNKNKPRNSIAELCLSHLKTTASIVKSVYVPVQEKSYPEGEYNDFDINIIYSINKKRRWEAEDTIGVDLLEDLNKLNNGWNVFIVERVTLKTYSWPACFYGSCAETFENFYPIRKFHYLNNDNEYHQKSVKSVFGQMYSCFLKNQHHASKTEGNTSTSSEPLASYNFLRAPNNYFTLLKKRYQSSNYGYDWPRAGYWNRLNRKKDRCMELRYEEIEDLNGEVIKNNEELDVYYDVKSKSQFYNFEEHIIDKFVIVKRRRRANKAYGI